MDWPRARYDHCVITGASSGIGSAFARALAPRAKRLTLTARRADRLQDLAVALERQHPVKCEVVVADLAVGEGPARLVERAHQDSPQGVDLLVNNAGFGRNGAWDCADWELWRRMLQVNVVAPAELLHRLWSDLNAVPGRGAINVSSTAGFQPLPWFATYAATKAFFSHLSLALAEEARRRGVRVLTLCPGPTRTEFGRVSGDRGGFRRVSLAPETVVATALRGYERGRREVIPGLFNRVVASVSRRAPRSLALAVAARVGLRAAPADRIHGAGRD